MNAQLPNLQTGLLRQVDIAAFKSEGGKQRLRIVEVQDRTRPMDEEFIDQVIGKCFQLGADKPTIVATAGLTSGALASIKKMPERIEAIELRPAEPAAWPPRWRFRHVPMSLAGRQYSAPLEHRLWIRPASGLLVGHVMLVHWAATNWMGAFVAPPSCEMNRTRFWSMGEPPKGMRIDSTTLFASYREPGDQLIKQQTQTRVPWKPATGIRFRYVDGRWEPTA